MIKSGKKQGIVDYKIRYILLSQCASQVSVGVNFCFDDWSADNFVFVPSIVYAGNRFDKKVMSYPPYWYNREEWRIDMPTTTTLVPSLEKYENYGKIELTTGNAATFEQFLRENQIDANKEVKTIII